MNTIEITLINGADGAIDEEASVVAAEETVRAFAAERRADEDAIKVALDQVFDTRPGQRLNMPFVINQALALMGVSQQPTNYTTLYERVHNFIKANSQGKTDKETKTVERPDSYFVSGRGKGNGLARRADLDALEADKLAQS